MAYTINTSLPTSSSIYTSGRGGKKIEWIIVHYTANAGSAWAHAEYCRRGGSGASSWHYVIDNTSIYQGVSDENTAWQAGNFDFNQRSIGIEVVSVGEDFSQGEISQLAWLVQKLMKQYNIDAAHVIRHYDVVDHVTSGSTTNPHKTCPAPYVPTYGDPTGEKWQKLHATITGHWKGELPMEFIGRSNTKEPLMYFNGLSYKPIATQVQSTAIQELYKKINGTAIPMIESPYVAGLKAVIDSK